jgi:hypothetical protein
MPDDKLTTPKPKLSIVPDDPEGDYASLMEKARELADAWIECGGDLSKTDLDLENWTASDMVKLQAAEIFLRKLKRPIEERIEELKKP